MPSKLKGKGTPSSNYPFNWTGRKTILLNTHLWFLRSVVHSVGWTLDTDVEKGTFCFTLSLKLCCQVAQEDKLIIILMVADRIPKTFEICAHLIW